MTHEKIVAALREHAERAVGNEWETPITLGDDLSAAADLIENQQREIEVLRQANEGLRFNLDLWMGHARKAVGVDDLRGEAQRNECPWGIRPEDGSMDSFGPTESSAPTEVYEVASGDEICRAALEAFGAEAQMAMAVEEMSELTKELCKYRRGRNNVEAIAEEIADVEIMLCQMKMLFDCAGQVETFRRYKLERLARRVEEAT